MGRLILFHAAYVAVGATLLATAFAAYRVARRSHAQSVGPDLATVLAYAALAAVLWFVGFSSVRGWIALAAHSRFAN